MRVGGAGARASTRKHENEKDGKSEVSFYVKPLPDAKPDRHCQRATRTARKLYVQNGGVRISLFILKTICSLWLSVGFARI